MGCASGLVKYLVFLANLLFALIGLGLVIVGILFKLNIAEVTRLIPGDLGIAPILSIVLGAIVFITAFLGCCGAVRESSCMLTTYSIILITIFIIQVAIGVYAYLQIKNENQLRSTIRNKVDSTFNEARHNLPEALEARNVLQRWLQCCGVDGPDEYNQNYPDSCCRMDRCPSLNNDIFSDGCANKLYNFLVSKSQLIANIAIGVAVVEIIGAIFGLCLASSITREYRRQNRYA
ncbi:CD63 antigen-like [Sitophilus oryzae]|uniref:Tetraspanin n=1 Tax=Sitophilus oryzae TaxID=7048 RepID=A0A6J2Y799_SITOR|nr:CD63 antigen-like [Sitophilus oryzae]